MADSNTCAFDWKELFSSKSFFHYLLHSKPLLLVSFWPLSLTHKYFESCTSRKNEWYCTNSASSRPTSSAPTYDVLILILPTLLPGNFSGQDHQHPSQLCSVSPVRLDFSIIFNNGDRSLLETFPFMASVIPLSLGFFAFLNFYFQFSSLIPPERKKKGVNTQWQRRRGRLRRLEVSTRFWRWKAVGGLQLTKQIEGP